MAIARGMHAWLCVLCYSFLYNVLHKSGSRGGELLRAKLHISTRVWVEQKISKSYSRQCRVGILERRNRYLLQPDLI